MASPPNRRNAFLTIRSSGALGELAAGAIANRSISTTSMSWPFSLTSAPRAVVCSKALDGLATNDSMAAVNSNSFNELIIDS